jgi:hypothetical protein
MYELPGSKKAPFAGSVIIPEGPRTRGYIKQRKKLAASVRLAGKVQLHGSKDRHYIKIDVGSGYEVVQLMPVPQCCRSPVEFEFQSSEPITSLNQLTRKKERAASPLFSVAQALLPVRFFAAARLTQATANSFRICLNPCYNILLVIYLA